MKYGQPTIFCFIALIGMGAYPSQAALKQIQKRVVCTGTMDTGSRMAGSRIGDDEGSTCFIAADSVAEHAVQAVCRSGSQCQVSAMAIILKNGDMQIQKVISVRQIAAAP